MVLGKRRVWHRQRSRREVELDGRLVRIRPAMVGDGREATQKGVQRELIERRVCEVHEARG